MFQNTYGTAALAGAFSIWIDVNATMCRKQAAHNIFETRRLAFSYCRDAEGSAAYEAKLAAVGAASAAIGAATDAYGAALDAFKALPADLQWAAEELEYGRGYLFLAA